MSDALQRISAALAGRYLVERELGHGGMATVYLAQDVRHHRAVAIKVLSDEISAAIGAERFLREIEIAASLTHPNILPLLDSGDRRPGQPAVLRDAVHRGRDAPGANVPRRPAPGGRGGAPGAEVADACSTPTTAG